MNKALLLYYCYNKFLTSDRDFVNSVSGQSKCHMNKKQFFPQCLPVHTDHSHDLREDWWSNHIYFYIWFNCWKKIHYVDKIDDGPSKYVVLASADLLPYGCKKPSLTFGKNVAKKHYYFFVSFFFFHRGNQPNILI